jgi:hypothetical protein
MLGVVVGQFKHYATVFQKLQLEQLQVGHLGQWWHDIRVLYLGNWR